jgi:predicted MFS family arabinose efflux permease
VAFIFVFGAISSFVAAGAIALRVREAPRAVAAPGPRARSVALDLTEFPHDPGHLAARATRPMDQESTERADGRPESARSARFGPSPRSLANRLLLAAILFTIGGNFAAGTYEVIWSVYLSRMGAGLDFIGLTFAMFGLPVLILSPTFGRRADRGGIVPYLVAGTVLPVVAALIYTVIGNPLLALPLILVEATGFAMFNPALFSIVAAGSPAGRSSSAQGVFGAAGTLGFVIASLLTGALAEIDIRLPFYLFAAVMSLFTVAAFATGGRALRSRPEAKVEARAA